MSPSATSSRRRRKLRLPALLVTLAALVAAGVALPVSAKVFLTVNESLELAFPGCDVKRETIYLTTEQAKEAEDLAGGELRSAIIHRYQAFKDGQLQGTAYFDTHRVRTLPETLMVVVDPQGRTQRLEILSFQEPEDYIPGEIWYAQFDGKPLTDELNLKRDIRGVTGATLTARATTEAVRRVLALHEVIKGIKGQGSENGDQLIAHQ